MVGLGVPATYSDRVGNRSRFFGLPRLGGSFPARVAVDTITVAASSAPLSDLVGHWPL